LTARPLALLLTLPLAAGCGGGSSSRSASYDLDGTKTCLSEQRGVLADVVPSDSLDGVNHLAGGLSVSWSLAPTTPPPAALILFATSDEASARMEASLGDVTLRLTGMKVARSLERSANASWAWIGPHRKAEERSLRDCLEESGQR
jgi:hypothetical protein